MDRETKKTIGLVVISVAAIALFSMWRSVSRDIDTDESPIEPLAAYIRSQNFVPIPPQGKLEPGAALRIDENGVLKPFGAPKDVFESADWVDSTADRWITTAGTSEFRDRVNYESSGGVQIESYLGLSGVFQKLGVTDVKTTLTAFRKWEVAELTLRRAKLRPDAAKVMAQGGIVIVQGVLRADDLRVEFLRESKTIDKDTVKAGIAEVDGGQDFKVTSEGAVAYGTIVLGYYDNSTIITEIPNDIDRDAATRKITATLDSAGVSDVAISGNRVVASVPLNRVPVTAKLINSSMDVVRSTAKAERAANGEAIALAQLNDTRTEIAARENDLAALNLTLVAQREDFEVQVVQLRDESAVVLSRADDMTQRFEELNRTYTFAMESAQSSREELSIRRDRDEKLNSAMSTHHVNAYFVSRRPRLKRTLERAAREISERLADHVTLGDWQRKEREIKAAVDQTRDAELIRLYSDWRTQLAEFRMIEELAAWRSRQPSR